MNPGVQGLGWLVRRSRDPDTLIAFYRDVVGAPYLRGVPTIGMLWIGGTVALEINGGDPSTLPPPDRSPCLPVFATDDLPGTVARLIAGGMRASGEHVDSFGATVLLTDPQGYHLGLRASAAPAAQWQTLPEPRSLGRGLLGLASVQRRVQDVARCAAFYGAIVGATPSMRPDGATLPIGDATALEILPGGAPEPIPDDRKTVADTFIFRVYDHPAVMRQLAEIGARIVNAPFPTPDGLLAYAVDPEGHLFGVQERRATSDRIEDQAARRQWTARGSAA